MLRASVQTHWMDGKIAGSVLLVKLTEQRQGSQGSPPYTLLLVVLALLLDTTALCVAGSKGVNIIIIQY